MVISGTLDEGLLPVLIRLGHKQWLHCHEYKHKIGKPCHQRMIALLHAEITREYMAGAQRLLPGDQHRLRQRKVQLEDGLIQLQM